MVGDVVGMGLIAVLFALVVASLTILPGDGGTAGAPAQVLDTEAETVAEPAAHPGGCSTSRPSASKGG